MGNKQKKGRISKNRLFLKNHKRMMDCIRMRTLGEKSISKALETGIAGYKDNFSSIASNRILKKKKSAHTNVQEVPLMKEKIDLVTVPCKCRLCLREITSLATPIWGDSGINEMVNRCCPVTVFETDQFQFVCLRCKHHLDYIDKFQQMCLRSNEIFLKMTVIKKEDPSSYSLNEDELAVEPMSEFNINLKEYHSEDEIVIQPKSEDNIKLEEIHSFEDEFVFEPMSEFNVNLEEYHYEDEIVIEPLSEADIKLNEILSPGENEAIDIATNFETEDEKEEEYLCKKCPMICFKEKDSLIHQKSHVQTNKGRRQKRQIYLCQICGKILKVIFKQHLRSHTHPRKPKECDQCGKILSGPSSLRAHKLTHQPNAPQHKCTLCESKFKFQKGLSRHMRSVHCENQDLISCPYCDRKFNRQPNMLVHLRTHTGEMPYSCPDCGISFAHRVTMKLHRLKEHKVDMFDPPMQKKLNSKRRRRRTNKKDDEAPSQDA